MSQDEFQGNESGPLLISDDTVLIALGSNEDSEVGLPEMTLRKAVEALETRGISIRAVSRFYRTPAFPAGSGPDFVNAAAVTSALCDPAQMLAVLHEVEAMLGRTRDMRWGPRTLDLDLIAFGSVVTPDVQTQLKWLELPLAQQQTVAPDQLILPHPRLQDRGFVLVPLHDVAPDWRHPVLKKTVREMLADLPEAAKKDVVALE